MSLLSNLVLKHWNSYFAFLNFSIFNRPKEFKLHTAYSGILDQIKLCKATEFQAAEFKFVSKFEKCQSSGKHSRRLFQKTKALRQLTSTACYFFITDLFFHHCKSENFDGFGKILLQTKAVLIASLNFWSLMVSWIRIRHRKESTYSTTCQKEKHLLRFRLNSTASAQKLGNNL